MGALREQDGLPSTALDPDQVDSKTSDMETIIII